MRWLWVALLLVGCNTPIENRAPVFQPLSGAIALKLKLALVPDTTAEYTLDDTPLPPDLHPVDDYNVVIDTTAFPDGLRHFFGLTTPGPWGWLAVAGGTGVAIGGLLLTDDRFLPGRAGGR